MGGCLSFNERLEHNSTRSSDSARATVSDARTFNALPSAKTLHFSGPQEQRARSSSGDQTELAKHTGHRYVLADAPSAEVFNSSKVPLALLSVLDKGACLSYAQHEKLGIKNPDPITPVGADREGSACQVTLTEDEPGFQLLRIGTPHNSVALRCDGVNQIAVQELELSCHQDLLCFLGGVLSSDPGLRTAFHQLILRLIAGSLTRPQQLCVPGDFGAGRNLCRLRVTPARGFSNSNLGDTVAATAAVGGPTPDDRLVLGGEQRTSLCPPSRRRNTPCEGAAPHEAAHGGTSCGDPAGDGGNGGHGGSPRSQLPALRAATAVPLAALVLELELSYQGVDLMARVQRDHLMLSSVPSIMTTFSSRGFVLHQNSASVAFMGYLVGLEGAAANHGAMETSCALSQSPSGNAPGEVSNGDFRCCGAQLSTHISTRDRPGQPDSDWMRITDAAGSPLQRLFEADPARLEDALAAVMAGKEWRGLVRMPSSLVAPTDTAFAFSTLSTDPATSLALASRSAGGPASTTTCMTLGSLPDPSPKSSRPGPAQPQPPAPLRTTAQPAERSSSYRSPIQVDTSAASRRDERGSAGLQVPASWLRPASPTPMSPGAGPSWQCGSNGPARGGSGGGGGSGRPNMSAGSLGAGWDGCSVGSSAASRAMMTTLVCGGEDGGASSYGNVGKATGHGVGEASARSAGSGAQSGPFQRGAGAGSQQLFLFSGPIQQQPSGQPAAQPLVPRHAAMLLSRSTQSFRWRIASAGWSGGGIGVRSGVSASSFSGGLRVAPSPAGQTRPPVRHASHAVPASSRFHSVSARGYTAAPVSSAAPSFPTCPALGTAEAGLGMGDYTAVGMHTGQSSVRPPAYVPGGPEAAPAVVPHGGDRRLPILAAPLPPTVPVPDVPAGTAAVLQPSGLTATATTESTVAAGATSQKAITAAAAAASTAAGTAPAARKPRKEVDGYLALNDRRGVPGGPCDAPSAAPASSPPDAAAVPPTTGTQGSSLLRASRSGSKNWGGGSGGAAHLLYGPALLLAHARVAREVSRDALAHSVHTEAAGEAGDAAGAAAAALGGYREPVGDGGREGCAVGFEAAVCWAVPPWQRQAAPALERPTARDGAPTPPCLSTGFGSLTPCALTDKVRPILLAGTAAVSDAGASVSTAPQAAAALPAAANEDADARLVSAAVPANGAGEGAARLSTTVLRGVLESEVDVASDPLTPLLDAADMDAIKSQPASASANTTPSRSGSSAVSPAQQSPAAIPVDAAASLIDPASPFTCAAASVCVTAAPQPSPLSSQAGRLLEANLRGDTIVGGLSVGCGKPSASHGTGGHTTVDGCSSGGSAVRRRLQPPRLGPGGGTCDLQHHHQQLPRGASSPAAKRAGSPSSSSSTAATTTTITTLFLPRETECDALGGGLAWQRGSSLSAGQLELRLGGPGIADSLAAMLGPPTHPQGREPPAAPVNCSFTLRSLCPVGSVLDPPTLLVPPAMLLPGRTQPPLPPPVIGMGNVHPSPSALLQSRGTDPSVVRSLSLYVRSQSSDGSLLGSAGHGAALPAAKSLPSVPGGSAGPAKSRRRRRRVLQRPPSLAQGQVGVGGAGAEITYKGKLRGVEEQQQQQIQQEEEEEGQLSATMTGSVAPSAGEPLVCLRFGSSGSRPDGSGSDGDRGGDGSRGGRGGPGSGGEDSAAAADGAGGRFVVCTCLTPRVVRVGGGGGQQQQGHSSSATLSLAVATLSAHACAVTTATATANTPGAPHPAEERDDDESGPIAGLRRGRCGGLVMPRTLSGSEAVREGSALSWEFARAASMTTPPHVAAAALRITASDTAAAAVVDAAEVTSPFIKVGAPGNGEHVLSDASSSELPSQANGLITEATFRPCPSSWEGRGGQGRDPRQSAGHASTTRTTPTTNPGQLQAHVQVQVQVQQADLPLRELTVPAPHPSASLPLQLDSEQQRSLLPPLPPPLPPLQPHRQHQHHEYQQGLSKEGFGVKDGSLLTGLLVLEVDESACRQPQVRQQQQQQQRASEQSGFGFHAPSEPVRAARPCFQTRPEPDFGSSCPSPVSPHGAGQSQSYARVKGSTGDLSEPEAGGRDDGVLWRNASTSLLASLPNGASGRFDPAGLTSGSFSAFPMRSSLDCGAAFPRGQARHGRAGAPASRPCSGTSTSLSTSGRGRRPQHGIPLQIPVVARGSGFGGGNGGGGGGGDLDASAMAPHHRRLHSLLHEMSFDGGPATTGGATATGDVGGGRASTAPSLAPSPPPMRPARFTPVLLAAARGSRSSMASREEGPDSSALSTMATMATCASNTGGMGGGGAGGSRRGVAAGADAAAAYSVSEALAMTTLAGVTSSSGLAGAAAAASMASALAGGGSNARRSGAEGQGGGVGGVAAGTSERWHEVTVRPCSDPLSSEPVILVIQTDVTSKVEAEGWLVEVLEAEHRLLADIFPRHVVRHMTQRRWQEARRQQAVLQGTALSCIRSLQHDASDLATSHESITVLFADIKGFTEMSKQVAPAVVMTFLNQLFTRFDTLTDVYGVYKVETIGDCYMVAGGLVARDGGGYGRAVRGQGDTDPLHAVRVVAFARAMLEEAAKVRLPSTGQPVQVRIGIHSGPATSGVVGMKMPRFCLFGDTVNTASRMESTGRPGCLHASRATHDLLPAEEREEGGWAATGGVEVKGKGRMESFIWSPQAALFERARVQRRASRAVEMGRVARVTRSNSFGGGTGLSGAFAVTAAPSEAPPVGSPAGRVSTRGAGGVADLTTAAAAGSDNGDDVTANNNTTVTTANNLDGVLSDTKLPVLGC